MVHDSGIYAITCLPSGKVYIGSTKRIKTRLGAHRSDLNAGKHGNSYLQKAWNKYGADAFMFSVLENCPPDILFEREQAHYDEIPEGLRFNLSSIWPRPIPSAETRLKLSVSLLGRSRIGKDWDSWRAKAQSRIEKEEKRQAAREAAARRKVLAEKWAIVLTERTIRTEKVMALKVKRHADREARIEFKLKLRETNNMKRRIEKLRESLNRLALRWNIPPRNKIDWLRPTAFLSLCKFAATTWPFLPALVESFSSRSYADLSAFCAEWQTEQSHLKTQSARTLPFGLDLLSYITSMLSTV